MELECKNVKVVACYLGERRDAREFPSSIFYMLQFLWKKEQIIDHGVPMDTLFIYNRLKDKDADKIEDKDNYKKCEDLLYSLDGQNTKNGKCYVIPRENIGISFGAFDFAYNKFKDKYDYWLFLEDDQIIVKDGVMRQCIKQLMNPSFTNSQCGYVSLSGIHDGNDGIILQWPIHVYGACGCTSRYILDRVFKDNFSSVLGRSCLPHYVSNIADMTSHSFMGEIPFTNNILNFGYSLERIKINKILISWGYSYVRNELYDSFSSFFPNMLFTEKMNIITNVSIDQRNFLTFNYAATKVYQQRIVHIIFKDLKNNTILYSVDEIFDISHGNFWSTVHTNVKEIEGIILEMFLEGRCILREIYKYDHGEGKIKRTTREEDEVNNKVEVIEQL